MTAFRCPALHRDQRGFLSPLIIFMLVALAYMIVWILDTGQMIYDKQRTQDTADAAALVHADWEARSLNIMAMNNVASTQAMVILVTSTALTEALADLGLRAADVGIQIGEYSSEQGWGEVGRLPLPTGAPYCPSWNDIPFGFIIEGACLAFQAIRSVGFIRAGAYVIASGFKYQPQNLILKSVDIIKAMNSMNDDLVNNFSDRVSKEALHLIKLDDADHVVFHPACTHADKQCREGQGGDLPVEHGVLAFQEMCRVADEGTAGFELGPAKLVSDAEFKNRGFPMDKGPFSAGGIDGRPIRDFVNDKSGMSTELPFFYRFYNIFGPAYYTSADFEDLLKKYAPKRVKIFGIKVKTPDWLLDAAKGSAETLLGGKLGVVNPFQLPIDENDGVPPERMRYGDDQSEETNDFTRRFDNLWRDVCPAGTLVSFINVLPHPYWLKGRVSVPSTKADGLVTRNNKGPNVAKTDQITDYRILAVVSRQPRARLQVSRFVDKTPSAYATAESWVHNYTSFDLYTQDWLATLAPATLMDDAQALSTTIKKTPVASSYQTLTSALDKGGSGGWSQINAH